MISSINRSLLVLLISLLPSLAHAQSFSYEYFRGSVDTMKASLRLVSTTTIPGDDTLYETYGVILLDQELQPYYYNAEDRESSSMPTDLIMTSYEYDIHADKEIKEVMQGAYANGKYIGELQLNGKKHLFAFEKVKDPYQHQQYSYSDITTEYIGKHPAQGDFTINLILPINPKLQQILIDEVIGVDRNVAQQSVDAMIKEYHKAWSESFITEVKDMAKDYTQEELDTTEYFFGANRSLGEELSPYLISEDLLIYDHTTYTYFGGAHGMTYSTYIIIDPKTNKRLHTFDILNEKYKDRIVNLIDKQIRKRFNIDDTTNFQDASNTPFIVDSTGFTENITVSKKGITFHYGLYDMTPYAYGFFEQFVPMEQLLPYLTPEFRKWFLKK